MDRFWYRNPSKSEVIGRCDGDEKTEWPRRTDKSRTLKTKIYIESTIELFSLTVIRKSYIQCDNSNSMCYMYRLDS